MKLVNSKSKQVLVEFREKETHFNNKFLEAEMKISGIPIPSGMRSYFGGKDIVYLGDYEFQKAFREVYYMQAFDPQVFAWEF